MHGIFLGINFYINQKKKKKLTALQVTKADDCFY